MPPPARHSAGTEMCTTNGPSILHDINPLPHLSLSYLAPGPGLFRFWLRPPRQADSDPRHHPPESARPSRHRDGGRYLPRVAAGGAEPSPGPPGPGSLAHFRVGRLIAAPSFITVRDGGTRRRAARRARCPGPNLTWQSLGYAKMPRLDSDADSDLPCPAPARAVPGPGGRPGPSAT
jgi:hypothetical protein